jgi:ABC-type cobalamin transport system permease subunit
MIKFEPLLLLVALGIWLLVLMSGGLRIWPKYLSSESLQRTFFEIRSNFALPQNLNTPLFVGVASAIVGALLAYLLAIR